MCVNWELIGTYERATECTHPWPPTYPKPRVANSCKSATRLSTSCGVVEQPDHHCGDDLVWSVLYTSSMTLSRLMWYQNSHILQIIVLTVAPRAPHSLTFPEAILGFQNELYYFIVCTMNERPTWLIVWHLLTRTGLEPLFVPRPTLSHWVLSRATGIVNMNLT